MKSKLIQIFGWYGVAAILAAYILLSFGLLGAKSVVYQLLNLTGSLGIISEAFSDRDWQPVVLNLIWAMVAIYALCAIFIKR